MTQTIIKVPAAGAFDPTDIELTDDTSGALLIKEGSNEYMRIDTTNGSEKTIFKTQSGASTGFFVNVPVAGDVLSIVRGGSPATVAKLNAGTTLFQVDSSTITADLISSNKTFKVDGTPGVTPLTIDGDGETVLTLDESNDASFKIKRNSTDVMTLKSDTDFTYTLKYDSSGTVAGGDAVENNFTIGTDRTGGSANLLEVTTRKLGLGEGEGVFFSGPSTSQVWINGPSVFRIQNGGFTNNLNGTLDSSTYLGGTGTWKVTAPGVTAAEIEPDSATTFTLNDASGAVFKVVDNAASPNTYLKAVEAGAVSTERNFEIYNSTAPAASVTDGCILFCEDVSSSSELKVRDEAGNVTTLSPHNFSLIPEGPSEEMAWSYYSEKDGKKINVDMLRLARLVEQISGEQIIFEEG